MRIILVLIIYHIFLNPPNGLCQKALDENIISFEKWVFFENNRKIRFCKKPKFKNNSITYSFSNSPVKILIPLKDIKGKDEIFDFNMNISVTDNSSLSTNDSLIIYLSNTYKKELTEHIEGKIYLNSINLKNLSNEINISRKIIKPYYNQIILHVIPYISSSVSLELKNIKFSIAIENNNEKLNYVPNGDFEIIYNEPEKLISNELFFYKWQDIVLNPSHTLEKGNLYYGNRQDSMVENRLFKRISLGTPDLQSNYIKDNPGNAMAYSGKYFARLLTLKSLKKNTAHFDEFLEVKLKNSLKKDTIYYFSIAVMNDPNTSYTSNMLGVKFTNNPFLPYDKPYFEKREFHEGNILFYEKCEEIDSSWNVKEFYFKAKGGEKFLTIGTFNNPFDNDFCKSNTPINSGNKYACYIIDRVILTEKSNAQYFRKEISNE